MTGETACSVLVSIMVRNSRAGRSCGQYGSPRKVATRRARSFGQWRATSKSGRRSTGTPFYAARTVFYAAARPPQVPRKTTSPEEYDNDNPGFLFVIYAATIVFIAANADNPHFITRTGIADFLEQPGFMFVQVLLLRFKPANMDVLPMYIAVLVGFVPMLWLLLRRPHLTLLASAALYAVAHGQGWALTSHSGRAWCFNPLAWQLLFLFGAWCALGGAARLAGLMRSRAATAGAVAYLVFALTIVTSWHVPALADAIPAWLCAWMYPISKPNLDVLRLGHFLALALLTVRLIGRDHPMLRSPLVRPLVRCGMHSLEIFSLGVLLSFVAHAALVQCEGGVAMQVLVSAIGISMLIAAVTLIAWGGRIEDSERPARAPALQPVPVVAG